MKSINFSILIIFLVSQMSVAAYSRIQFYPRFYNRGIMTGVPVPIYQNIPYYQEQQFQPYYVNRRYIKKKYRNPSKNKMRFSVIEY